MAIAVDSTSNGGNASSSFLNVSHTCTGTGTTGVLISCVRTNPNTVTVATMKYGGVNMTLLGTVLAGTANELFSFYYLLAPSAGTATIAANYSASNDSTIFSASYTGVKQTGFPDSTATGAITSGTTSRTLSTTVVLGGCWLVAVIGNDTGLISAGTGTTLRSVYSSANNQALFDSNGTVGTGTQSLQGTWMTSGDSSGIILSMAPFVPVATTNGAELLMMM